MQFANPITLMRTERSAPYSWTAFVSDAKAGVILLMVEIPFAMGIGVVSGMGIVAALYCMVIVGLVGAILGGTRCMVSGPAVAVAVIVGPLMTSGQIGLPEIAFITILAGAIQVVLGFAAVGRFMAYLPHVVLTGFISGIGCLLVWSQVVKLIELGFADVAIAGICLAIILVWPNRLHQFVPRQLAGVIAGWAASAAFLPGGLLLGTISTAIPKIAVAMPSASLLSIAIGPAITIALISSAYTLMIAQSVDSMTGGRHNSHRQLAATGVANIAAGVFGAVPGAGQFGAMATVVLGGRTVVAGIVVALLTAGFIFGLSPYLKTLPIAAILAVVIWIGWELIDWHLVKKLRKAERRHGLVFFVTLLFATAGDPFSAVVLGLITAFIGNAASLERKEMDNVLSVPLLDSTLLEEDEDADPLSARAGLLAFRGSFTAASSRRLAVLLEEDIRDHEVAIFDLSGITHMDDSAAHLLQLLLRKAEAMGIEVVVFGLPDSLRGILEAFSVLKYVPDGRIVEDMEEAKAVAVELLTGGKGGQSPAT